MLSQRQQEGYLLLDHRHTMGVPDEVVVANGLPVGSGRGLFEAPTYTCSHCQTVVVMNPDRKRERVHCRGCDHLICDACGVAKAAGAKCRTMKQVIDEMQEQAERQAGSFLVLP